MPVTLKDVAAALGVTTTSVHRALNGKEGVSDELREKIQLTAAQMGYKTNFIAAALKRKDVRVAVALPEPVGDSRYYYGSLWAGIRDFISRSAGFNLTVEEYSYPLQLGANASMLEQLYAKPASQLDGVLTMGLDESGSLYFMEKFAAKKTPVVLIGSNLPQTNPLCCVKSNDRMAGSLAAELLVSFCYGAPPATIVAVGHFGQLGMRDQLLNLEGFRQYLEHAKVGSSIISLQSNHEPGSVKTQLKEILSTKEVAAVYSSSARQTIMMAEAVQELQLPRPPVLIGNDLFSESRRLLAQGLLSAIIDKKISNQGYLAMETLFNHLVKDEYPSSGILQLNPEVVLKSNLSAGSIN